jgi:hypothetical protein
MAMEDGVQQAEVTSHELARQLLARRDNTVRIELLTNGPDGETFLTRTVGLRDQDDLAAAAGVCDEPTVYYDPRRDVVIIRAGFIGTDWIEPANPT